MVGTIVIVGVGGVDVVAVAVDAVLVVAVGRQIPFGL